MTLPDLEHKVKDHDVMVSMIDRFANNYKEAPQNKRKRCDEQVVAALYQHIPNDAQAIIDYWNEYIRKSRQ